MKRNRYIDSPSIYEVIGWVALLGFFFWAMFWGLKYIILGVVWLVSFI
jgi:hypothetical protein